MTRPSITLAVLLAACNNQKGATLNNNGASMPVDADGDGYDVFHDCDDGDPNVHPGADEVCNSVDDDCDGTVDFGFTVNAQFATIQDAIDAAQDGDVVCVPPGKYEEDINFLGKDIEVYGYEGPDQTTIVGVERTRVVTLASGEGPDAWLHGFTITGGFAETGAGIYVVEGAPTLEDLVVEGNECAAGEGSTCRGTGVAVVDADATLIDVEIRGNRAEAAEVCGAGLYVGSSSTTTSVSPELTDVSVLDNYATAIIEEGAAEGGGACFEWLASSGNLQPTWDGGTVAGNAATADGGIAVGGGIALVGDSLPNFQAMHLFVADNTATGREVVGGGLGHRGGAPGEEAIRIDASVFANNRADGDLAIGGAIGLDDYLSAGLWHLDLVGNEASTAGGAVGFAGSDTGYIGLLASNVVSNRAVEGSVFGWIDGSPDLEVGYSDIYDNGDPEYADPALVDDHDNIAADPLYLGTGASSAVNWDLHLDPSSPCVDPAASIDTDPNGSPGDIGAYGGTYGSGYHAHWK